MNAKMENSICNHSEMDLCAFDLANSPDLASGLDVTGSDALWLASDPSLYSAATDNSSSKEQFAHFDEKPHRQANIEEGALCASIDTSWLNQSFDLNAFVGDSLTADDTEKTIFEEIVRESEAFVPQADLCQQAMEMSGLVVYASLDSDNVESPTPKLAKLETAVSKKVVSSNLFAVPIKSVPMPEAQNAFIFSPRISSADNETTRSTVSPNNALTSSASTTSDSEDNRSILTPSVYDDYGKGEGRKRSAPDHEDYFDTIQIRKREQNREAARRYRMNKKREKSKQFEERSVLESRNEHLRTKAEDLEKQVDDLKNLLQLIEKARR